MAAPNCLAKKADKCLYQNSAAVGNREEFSAARCFRSGATTGMHSLALPLESSIQDIETLAILQPLQMSQTETLGQSSFTVTEQNLQ